MKLFLMTLLASFITCNFVFSQDLSGTWKGGLPQDDKTFVWTMETTMKQEGNKLTGTSKYVDIHSQYVVERFAGTINDDDIFIKEFEIVRSTDYTNWCLKTMHGKLTIDKANNTYIIEGDWQSQSLYNATTHQYYRGECSPGQFRITKSLPVAAVTKPSSPFVANFTISGQIINKVTLDGVKAILTIISENSPRRIVSTDNDGDYTYQGVANTTYNVLISADNYEPLRETVSLGNVDSKKNFFLVPKATSTQPAATPSIRPEENKPILLKNVTFELHLPKLLPQSFSELDNLVTQMKSNPKLRIRLEGHTDKIDKSDPNADLILSEKRVKTVKDYLTSNGISGDRIETKGYGQSKPLFSPPNEANRRVEFVILNQ